MNTVTIDAAFAYGLVIEHVRPGLFAMALRANIVNTRDAHAFRIVNVITVRVVTADTGHPTFFERMMIRQIELGFLVDMALETGFRVFAWIDNELAFAATGIDVETAGTVAAFAALAGNAFFLTGDLDPRVLGKFKISNLFFVTGRTSVHADVLRAGDQRRGNEDPVNRCAGYSQGERSASAEPE